MTPECFFTKKSMTILCVPNSAGIGRTGTYIAIDALYEECEQKKKINVAEYVEKMREKRMNMVQTYVNIIYNTFVFAFCKVYQFIYVENKHCVHAHNHNN